MNIDIPPSGLRTRARALRVHARLGEGGCDDVSAHRGFGFWEHKHTHQPFSVCCGHPLSVQHKDPATVELKHTEGWTKGKRVIARTGVCFAERVTDKSASSYNSSGASRSSDSRLKSFIIGASLEIWTRLNP